ncbi:FlgN protein [Caloramator quimbayensis]|uniref:FlgN protein n=1 Tax=Caloramator quimbayensis TaxID=1147123 RepID=A0A1T4XAM2_9CLOT|nr:flagellar export chaperone FlgN [Caloramator quimbayensis]SKA86148.1 FlgN protein [Caloramator quimbayensis]
MDIENIVKRQIELLTELDNILNKEKDILINDRAFELPNLIEEKKEISKKIVEIEKVRLSLYKDKTAEELLEDGIINRDDVSALKALIESIKQKQETNLILTKQSLYYIRLITSALNPNQKVITYKSSGKVDDAKSLNIFTTKG